MELTKTNPETPKPAAYNDVTPPPKSEAVAAPFAQAPPLDPNEVAQRPAPEAPAPAAKPAGPKKPVAALFFAVIFFVALAAAAYYAYTKSN